MWFIELVILCRKHLVLTHIARDIGISTRCSVERLNNLLRHDLLAIRHEAISGPKPMFISPLVNLLPPPIERTGIRQR